MSEYNTSKNTHSNIDDTNKDIPPGSGSSKNETDKPVYNTNIPTIELKDYEYFTESLEPLE